MYMYASIWTDGRFEKTQEYQCVKSQVVILTIRTLLLEFRLTTLILGAARFAKASRQPFLNARTTMVYGWRLYSGLPLKRPRTSLTIVWTIFNRNNRIWGCLKVSGTLQVHVIYILITTMQLAGKLNAHELTVFSTSRSSRSAWVCWWRQGPENGKAWMPVT